MPLLEIIAATSAKVSSLCWHPVFREILATGDKNIKIWNVFQRYSSPVAVLHTPSLVTKC